MINIIIINNINYYNYINNYINYNKYNYNKYNLYKLYNIILKQLICNIYESNGKNIFMNRKIKCNIEQAY